MLLNRRDILAIAAAGTGSAAFASLGLPLAGSTDDLHLIVPDRVLRGVNTSIVARARDAKKIQLYSDQQPTGPLATFHFGDGSADVCAAMNVSLQRGQTIIAQADMKNGQVCYAAAYVAVFEQAPSA